MKFIAQGKILSKVDCHNERIVKAARFNKSVEEVPLTFGSLRMGVNLIQMDDTIYTVDRRSNDTDIREVRLILEISYKFNKEGKIKEAHDVINELTVGNPFQLHMDSAFLSKDHLLKYAGAGKGRVVKSYFIKSWADRINFLSTPELKMGSELITPKDVLKRINLNKELIIA